MALNDRILVIGDIHAPYEHPDTVAFLKAVKKKYNPTRVIQIGDECFPPEAEILTNEGFVRFDELKDQKVAQWHEDFTIDFVNPERKVVKEFDGELLEYRQSNLVSRTTPKHNLVKIDEKGVVHRREAWDSKGNLSWNIPRNGKQSGIGCGLSDSEIQLMVAFQADGTWTKGGARFGFTKQRKADRLVFLLQEAKVPYNVHNVERGDFQFYIEKDNVPSYFTKEFSIPLELYSNNERKVFIDELFFWDGTNRGEGSCRYTSVVKKNAEYVFSMLVLGGVTPHKIMEDEKSKENHNNSFRVDFVFDREKSSFSSAKQSNIPYKGLVYCVTVPTRMIVVRQDGHVSVSGNCDYHAISFHDHNPDLPSPGDELEQAIESLKPIMKLFPKMDILESNHGSLVMRKAMANGLPKHFFKSYRDILHAPKGWNWHFDMVIKLPTGMECYFHHGKNKNPLKVAQSMGMCYVGGHYHEDFSILFYSNPNQLNFAMQVGCLVDKDSLAMAYAKNNLKRPIIGCAMIVEGIPLLIPMLLSKGGRWTGKLLP
jgi:hypothetical protein